MKIPNKKKEKESACSSTLLNPNKKKIDAVKLKKIWKNKDNPKDIYTHGELKEGKNSWN